MGKKVEGVIDSNPQQNRTNAKRYCRDLPLDQVKERQRYSASDNSRQEDDEEDAFSAEENAQDDQQHQ